MSALKARIAGLIATAGPISVAEYMALCLSNPEHGYYMTRDPFGSDGDFTTAPEISQMFGELIGAWIAETWRLLGQPAGAMVVEIGPGRGTLMRDMARTLAKIAPGLHHDGAYALVETSPKLRAAQASALESSAVRFEWHAEIGRLPRRPMLIVGNELFDALPVRQYVKTGQGWRERVVDIDAMGGLRFAAGWFSTNLLVNDIETEKARLKSWIDFTRAAGGDHINACECSNTVHGNDAVPVNDRPILTDAEWERFSTGYEELSRFAAERGVSMGYHHHMGTGVQTRADVDRLMAMTDPGLVHLLLDTGHLHFAGDDPLALAEAYAERIGHVHLKNIRQPVMDEALANGWSFEEAIKHGVFTVPGDPEGCIAFEPILDVLAARGYRGWLVVEAEQDPNRANPLDYATLARSYLRDVIGF